jgi:hypothetical protein
MSSLRSNRQGTSPYLLGQIGQAEESLLQYALVRRTVRLSDNAGSATSATVAAYLKAVKHPLFGDLPIHSR